MFVKAGWKGPRNWGPRIWGRRIWREPSSARWAPKHHPVIAVAGWWTWAMAEVSVVLFVLYRQTFTPWEATAAQVIAYAVLVAPVLLLGCPLQTRASRPRRLISLGVGVVAVVVAIVVIASAHSLSFTARQVVTFVATGVGEEILWRGAIWTALTRATPRLEVVAALDVVLFVSWHIPSIFAGDSTWAGLPAVAALGTVFCLARIASRQIGLPSLLHIAADLLGT